MKRRGPKCPYGGLGRTGLSSGIMTARHLKLCLVATLLLSLKVASFYLRFTSHDARHLTVRLALGFDDHHCAIHEGALLKRTPRLPWTAPTIQAFKDEGVVYNPKTVSAATAASLRVHCESKLVANLAAIASGSCSYSACFGTVRARTSRHDLKLTLDPPVTDTLAEALVVLGPLLCGMLECDDPYLAALGAVGSTEGAPRQLIHSDTRCFEAPELLTVFIALQDIDEQMGPTTFLPRTANSAAHAAMLESSHKDKLLSDGPIRLGTMPIGASTLYDTRLLHGGGANTSHRSRWLFYATFATSRSIANEIHGQQYTVLQQELHTVSTLQHGTNKLRQDERGWSESEAQEWAMVMAALRKEGRGG